MYKVYILHGWTYSTEKWEPFLKILRENGVEYKVLKIPGLTAPLSNIWTLDDYTSWLNRITKNEERITLLGHSNGGRIAAAFTAKYPGRVSHLILIDSAGIIDRGLRAILKKYLFEFVAKTGKKIIRSSSVRNLLYRAIGEQDYNRADPILKRTMINLISENLDPSFAKITVPTLIIWGGNDKITPISDGKKINELIHGSKLEVIDTAKHSPQFTHPQKTTEIILKFLAI